MSDDSIFKEVDEELRSDRMRSLWSRFGPYVIGAAVLVVLMVAVNEGWSWWQKTQAAQSSDQFYAALKLADGSDVEAAQKALDGVIASGSGGYPTLARFRQAALLARSGKTDDAIAAYDALATNETNPHLREVALVLAAYLLVDKGDVAGVEQRVSGIITPADPMRNAARETLGLAKYKAGDLDGAAKVFEDAISDPTGDAGMRSRLQLYLSQLIAEGAADPNAAAGEPAAAPAAGGDGAEAAPAVVDEAPAMDVTPPPADSAPAAEAPPDGTTGAAPAESAPASEAPAQ
jgi:hypothetical protein